MPQMQEEEAGRTTVTKQEALVAYGRYTVPATKLVLLSHCDIWILSSFCFFSVSTFVVVFVGTGVSEMCSSLIAFLEITGGD